MKKVKLSSIALIAGLILLQACASGRPATPRADFDYHARAQTQERNNISVTASVPDRQEPREIFKTDLYKRRVQPVWLEITNSHDEEVHFLPVGLDPGYFSPIEAANLDLELIPNGNSSASIDGRFFGRSLQTVIQPGETQKGFIFSRLDEGTKSFNVDVISTNFMTTFTFFIPVPGLLIDHHQVDWANLYDTGEFRDLDRRR